MPHYYSTTRTTDRDTLDEIVGASGVTLRYHGAYAEGEIDVRHGEPSADTFVSVATITLRVEVILGRSTSVTVNRDDLDAIDFPGLPGGVWDNLEDEITRVSDALIRTATTYAREHR